MFVSPAFGFRCSASHTLRFSGLARFRSTLQRQSQSFRLNTNQEASNAFVEAGKNELYGRLVVLDFETTGYSASRGDRVLSVGAVEMLNGKITGRVFNTLINNPKASTESALSAHGLTAEKLAGAPSPETVFPALRSFLSDSVLVAHNAKFDASFLFSEMKIVGIQQKYPLKYFCTLGYFQKTYKVKYTLKALCDAYGVSQLNPDIKFHDAANDSYMLALVMEKYLSTKNRGDRNPMAFPN